MLAITRERLIEMINAHDPGQTLIIDLWDRERYNDLANEQDAPITEEQWAKYCHWAAGTFESEISRVQADFARFIAEG